MSNSPYVEIPISDDSYELDSLRRRSPTKSTFDSFTNENSQFIKVFGRISNQIKETQTEILPQDEYRIKKIPEAPEELVDVIDAKETEEPFTLEAFDDLVRMHLEKNKDFILARVTTKDDTDPNRFYYSYYSAHQINKVIFRTQPQQGLLHRMQAKNPLNNMTIVGDVHYYVIKKGSLIENSRKSPTRTKLYATVNESTLEKILSPAFERILGFSHDKKKTLNFMAKTDTLQVKKSGKSNSVSSSRRNSADDAAVIKMTSPINEIMQKDDFTLNASTITKNQDLAHINVRSISYKNDSDGAASITEWMRIHTQHEAKRAKVLATKSKPDASTPLVKECTWEAHYFASDDDFLLDSKVRAYFKENALEKDDATLFSLPSSDTAQYSDGIQHPALDNYVFTYRDASGNTPINHVFIDWSNSGQNICPSSSLFLRNGNAFVVLLPHLIIVSVRFICAHLMSTISLDSTNFTPIDTIPPPFDRPVRVYADGIFDLFHYGHARALEQAKKSFPNTILIVGVCSDITTYANKGRSVMKDYERYESVRHCRWVDEVVEDAPWVITKDFLDKYDIDYVAHDAIPYTSGNSDDVYAEVKELGRFVSTKRTKGISTTDLITRVIKDYDEYIQRNYDRGISLRSMNVTYLKQGELYMKSKVKKVFSLLYRIYTGTRETRLPDFLKRKLLYIENMLCSFLKKKD